MLFSLANLHTHHKHKHNNTTTKSAPALRALQDGDTAGFDAAVSDASFRPYLFRLKAAQDTYNDETRLKVVVVFLLGVLSLFVVVFGSVFVLLGGVVCCVELCVLLALHQPKLNQTQHKHPKLKT